MTDQPTRAARTKWTPDLDARLKHLAEVGLTGAEAGLAMDLSESSVRGRASRIGVSFDSGADGGLRARLHRGAPIMCEDVGGAVGLRWSTPERNGENYDPGLCAELLEAGIIGQAISYSPNV